LLIIILSGVHIIEEHTVFELVTLFFFFTNAVLVDVTAFSQLVINPLQPEERNIVFWRLF
jgi:hypothetical protein